MTNKVEYGYLWAINQNGLLENIKFVNELDLDTIKKGDTIKSFYGEEFIFYNVCEPNKVLGLNGLEDKNVEENLDYVRLLCQKLMKEAQRIPADDLTMKNRDEPSILDDMLDKLARKNVVIEYNHDDFNLDKYLDARNELMFEVSFLNNSNQAALSVMVNILDAFVFNCGYLKNSDGVVLFKEDPDSDESVPENEKQVYYSEIASAKRYFDGLEGFLLAPENQKRRMKF